MTKTTYDREWHGLSCECGGGYAVGHRSGCPSSSVEMDIRCIKQDRQEAIDNNDYKQIKALNIILSSYEKSLNYTND